MLGHFSGDEKARTEGEAEGFHGFSGTLSFTPLLWSSFI